MRALDLALEEVFPETMPRLFPGNPLEHLAEYRNFTESSFLVDVQRWADDDLRSLNAQIEFLLRRTLLESGRLKEPPAKGTK